MVDLQRVGTGRERDGASFGVHADRKMALEHGLAVDPHDDTVVGSGPQSDPFRSGGEPYAAPADEVVTGRSPELVEKGQIDVRRPFLGGGDPGNVEPERVGRRSQGIVEAARQPAAW